MHTCWLYERRWHFSVGAGWTIALSPDSAGRFRLDACRHTRTVHSVWVLPCDRDALVGSVRCLTSVLVDEPGRD
jgi:hypothetical protein